MSKHSEKQVWESFDGLDVGRHTKKKGKFTYLSWAHAWRQVMEHYPDSTFECLDPTPIGDTLMVWVEVTIADVTRKMFLPVMDARNNAVPNPNARQVSDAYMRCLVKCIGLFGLGLYIYAGEDVPITDPLDDYIKAMDDDNPLVFLEYISSKDSLEQTEILNSAPKGQKTALKKKEREIVNAAEDILTGYADQLMEYVTFEDPALVQFWDELTSFERHKITARWDEVQLGEFKSTYRKLNQE